MNIHTHGFPSAIAYQQQHRLLDDCIRGPRRTASVAALDEYFHQHGPGPRYTGRWFERFAGGGDRPDIANTITEADVLSLNFLNITGLADVAIDTLHAHARRITELLAQIPTDTPMHTAGWTTYAPGSPADQLWELFRQCGGHHRPVTAATLLARKRPHLIPVYDNRVKTILNDPTSSWQCLWTWFHTDPTRATALTRLRADAGNITDISLLRCLDIILWMQAAPRHGRP